MANSFELDIVGDILEVRSPISTLQLADAKRIFGAFGELSRQHARLFFLVDTSGAGMTADARKYMVDWLKNAATPVECAIHGAGVVQRAIGDMIQRAVNFLAPGTLVLVSFHAREDALAWIAARRQLPPPRPTR
jgi:hypothetical protein